MEHGNNETSIGYKNEHTGAKEREDARKRKEVSLGKEKKRTSERQFGNSANERKLSYAEVLVSNTQVRKNSLTSHRNSANENEKKHEKRINRHEGYSMKNDEIQR